MFPLQRCILFAALEVLCLFPWVLNSLIEFNSRSNFSNNLNSPFLNDSGFIVGNRSRSVYTKNIASDKPLLVITRSVSTNRKNIKKYERIGPYFNYMENSKSLDTSCFNFVPDKLNSKQRSTIYKNTTITYLIDLKSHYNVKYVYILYDILNKDIEFVKSVLSIHVDKQLCNSVTLEKPINEGFSSDITVKCTNALGRIVSVKSFYERMVSLNVCGIGVYACEYGKYGAMCENECKSICSSSSCNNECESSKEICKHIIPTYCVDFCCEFSQTHNNTNDSFKILQTQNVSRSRNEIRWDSKSHFINSVQDIVVAKTYIMGAVKQTLFPKWEQSNTSEISGKTAPAIPSTKSKLKRKQSKLCHDFLVRNRNNQLLTLKVKWYIQETTYISGLEIEFFRFHLISSSTLLRISVDDKECVSLTMQNLFSPKNQLKFNGNKLNKQFVCHPSALKGKIVSLDIRTFEPNAKKVQKDSHFKLCLISLLKCHPAFYGPRCHLTCNCLSLPCHPVIGSCPTSCKNGYNESQCSFMNIFQDTLGYNWSKTFLQVRSFVN